MRIGFGRVLRGRLVRQLVAMHVKRRPDPEWIDKMIPARIGRVRMHQDAQAAMVEHQPRHQGGKQLPGKGHLIHRLIMRTDFHVMPAPERDGKALADQIGATGGRLVTVEDHWPEGGIGEAVITALAQVGVAPSRFRLLAVTRMPHSGKPDELLDAFGISARDIAASVRDIA